jgi:hypothetical protein
MWSIEEKGDVAEVRKAVIGYNPEIEVESIRAQLANAKGVIVSELNYIGSGPVRVEAAGGVDGQRGLRIAVETMRPQIELVPKPIEQAPPQPAD